ncbi:hypothetical protein DICSQDRAFT_171095 [Dichomitus squalens LYAD-421 SS1]|uniref:Uncharacterized protein n=1 Tax=Dichomitus squalens (strain LYAD-421) TaxID=732165 RepID=R7SWP2_DICSQ|nr:uncharacterized protein DICSQDRAFT_171095 [Dichomitus squalens LYAD-421 SS1]EJF60373.1 hypothetical protein DICSQDRAFT_171095 [Dichomitus squalens LYAD-421 SS1]
MGTNPQKNVVENVVENGTANNPAYIAVNDAVNTSGNASCLSLPPPFPAGVQLPLPAIAASQFTPRAPSTISVGLLPVPDSHLLSGPAGASSLVRASDLRPGMANAPPHSQWIGSSPKLLNPASILKSSEALLPLLADVPYLASSENLESVQARAMVIGSATVAPHVTFDVPVNAAPNVVGNVAPRVAPRAALNVAENTARNIMENTAPNVPRNAAPNVSRNAAPNVSRNAALNVTGHAAPYVAGNAALNVSGNAAPYVAPNVAAAIVGHLSGLFPAGEDEDEDEDKDEDEDDEDVEEGDGPNATGRISEASLERVRDGLIQVQKSAKDIAAETGLSLSQVFDRWMSTSQRTHTKRNPWNLYSAYFKDNEEQELARLREPCAEGASDTDIRRACYRAFLANMEPKAHEILTKYSTLRQIQAGKRQTNAERKAQFRKFQKKLQDHIDAFESLHGFRAAFVCAGSIPNSDGGLGAVYESKLATGFFESRCRANPNTILSHFKVQVFNTASMDVVSMTFDAERSRNRTVRASTQNQPLAGSIPTKALAPEPSGALKKPTGLEARREELERENPERKPELSRWVTEALLLLLNNLDIPGKGKIAWKTVPWRLTGSKLAPLGIQWRHFPEGVPLPPISVRKGFKKEKASKRRGESMQSLSQENLYWLYRANKDPKYPLHFTVYHGEAIDLETSIEPIVLGAPPSCDSDHVRGCRLFADGRVDRWGPSRLPPPRDHGKDVSSDVIAGDENGEDDMEESSDSSDISDADSDDTDDTDSKSSKVSLKRKVARLFKMQSDKGSSMPDAKREKTKGDGFRPVPVRIATTPIRSEPVTGPSGLSKIMVSSDSGAERNAEPTRPPKCPSKIQPSPQKKKRALSTTRDDPVAFNLKGKGKPARIGFEVYKEAHFTMALWDMLT